MAKRDVYSDVCPSRVLLDLLANKWSALVIGLLERGPTRFGARRVVRPGRGLWIRSGDRL